MKNLILPFLLALTLVGCASTTHGPLTVHQRYEAACVGAATAYGVIATVNAVHPLTVSQQANALLAKHKIDQRCQLAPGQDYPYTASEAVLSELESAAATLNQIKGAAR
jgi:hypothetical protein